MNTPCEHIEIHVRFLSFFLSFFCLVCRNNFNCLFIENNHVGMMRHLFCIFNFYLHNKVEKIYCTHLLHDPMHASRQLGGELCIEKNSCVRKEEHTTRSWWLLQDTNISLTVIYISLILLNFATLLWKNIYNR